MISNSCNRNLDIILIILGGLSILYYLGLNIAYGKTAFSFIFLLFGALISGYGFLELRFNINFWTMIPAWLRVCIAIFFAVGLSIFVVVEGIIFFEGHYKDKTKPDYLMVLGAGLRGEEISRSLKYRLDTAIEFNNMYPDVKIIVSGGQGPGEDITEAKAMKDYLVSHGVDEKLIISEDKSTTTYENFLFTKKLLNKKTGRDDYTLTVISNNFHMYRAKLLGDQVGFNCLGYPAPCHFTTSLNFHVREFFAVIKAYIFKV